jgi:hypothetical protein
MQRKSLGMVFGVLLFALATMPGVSGSDNVAKTTYLTFSQPMRLPGVALGSGTYIFELANPMSGADVVRVMSRDRKTAYFQGFTTRVERHRQLSPNAVVSFGESARETAPPITAWWPLGESTGRAFIYR